MIRPIITVLLVLGATVPIGAQDAPLTLEQAVATALENNPNVLAAEADAAAASTTRREARGFRLPSVDLTQSYTYTDNPAEVFALTLNQGRFDMDQFFGSDPNAPDALSTFITRLEVTQPIYTGGMIGTRNDQASLMAEAADLEARHTREKVAFETATAFANATKAAEHLTVVRRARDTTAAHVDLARTYADQGLIVTAEVLNAQVHLARMEEMVAEAEAQVTLAQAALNLHLGLPQTTRHELAQLPPAPPVEGAAAAWIDSATQQRLDLSARRAELEAGRLEEKAARASFWPEVGVKGSYDLYDDTLFGSNGHSGSVMAFARVNLYRGGSDTARTEKAALTTRSGEERIRLFSEAVQLETRQAWELRHTAGRRQETAAAAVEAAREAMRVREQRFSQGLDKMIDLLDAETALHESELRELVARYDLILSTYQLYFASGSPLATRLGGAAEGDAR
jgi:outer membrane protein